MNIGCLRLDGLTTSDATGLLRVEWSFWAAPLVTGTAGWGVWTIAAANHRRTDDERGGR